MNKKNDFSQKMHSYLRHPASLIMMILVKLAAFITFTVLIFLIVYILVHGVPYLKPSLFSLHYNSENASLMPALINTVIMTLLSLLLAVPIGIFSAILWLNMLGRAINLWILSDLLQRLCQEFRLSYMGYSECCSL